MKLIILELENKYVYVFYVLVLLASCGNKTLIDICKCEVTNNMEEGSFLHFVHLEDALSCSRKTGKPILVIFTAWASMWDSNASWEIYQDDEIRRLIDQEFIELALYCDDKTLLEEEYVSDFMNREYCINTRGKKNRDFQAKEFNSIIQPFYGILDSKFNHLANPIGYTSLEKRNEFELFLRSALEKNNRLKVKK